MNAKEILDLPMQENDAEAETVRDYFKAILEQLWSEREGFSGKRPFGNSGWEYDLYRALVSGKAVSGEIDEYGDMQNFDRAECDRIVFEAIEELS